MFSRCRDKASLGHDNLGEPTWCPGWSHAAQICGLLRETAWNWAACAGCSARAPRPRWTRPGWSSCAPVMTSPRGIWRKWPGGGGSRVRGSRWRFWRLWFRSLPPPVFGWRSVWGCRASEGGTRAWRVRHHWPVSPNTARRLRCRGAGWSLQRKSQDEPEWCSQMAKLGSNWPAWSRFSSSHLLVPRKLYFPPPVKENIKLYLQEKNGEIWGSFYCAWFQNAVCEKPSAEGLGSILFLTLQETLQHTPSKSTTNSECLPFSLVDVFLPATCISSLHVQLDDQKAKSTYSLRPSCKNHLQKPSWERLLLMDGWMDDTATFNCTCLN